MLRLPCILCLAACATLAATAQDAAPAPKTYECQRATKPLHINGKLNDSAWKKASWTTDFVDIQGAAKPNPRFRTRIKMLWDDQYLYIAAELEEPDVKATILQHDAVIFHDNDFEVFIKPLPQTESYYEFEMNAFNTSWDLYLNRPYTKGGKADNSWEIPDLKTAVTIQGSINKSVDKDHGWTLEIAYPWTAFQSRQPEVTQPHPGSEWRVNFSRVEWKTGQPKEDNWVWTPQSVINMHVPEHWGYLHFR
jgi:hypothetical protein